MNFKFKVDFEGKTIAKKKGKRMSDFDDMMDDLKEKFKED